MGLLTACSTAPAPLTLEEKSTVTQLTENLKPHCVGRYLIDLPEDMLASGSATIEGVDVEAEAMPEYEFEHQLEKRAKALHAIKHFEGYRFLYEDGQPDGKNSRYFISLGDAHELSDSTRVIEAYKWDRGYRITLKIVAHDDTHSIHRNEPLYQQNFTDDLPAKRQRVLDLLSHIRGRAETDIPKEPGLCFFGGFWVGKATSQENVSTFCYLKEKPDVTFQLDTDSNIRETTTLLDRSVDIHAMLKADGDKTIRKGPVPLPGLQTTDEWLTAGLTQANIPGQFMTLEANSKVGSAQTPLLTLTMHNGSPPLDIDWKSTHASLTENEAVALWDAVSRTLRPRTQGF
jgi:hypothetical protein